ncbi:M48 family metallopeptidase [Nostoc sp. UCD121]|uniref:M48 family metallopeptidase n=1 Tax=unclassified Nostoc TaxID=2593658 RepID=UPI001625DE31|nr:MULTISPECIES: M48 family metallopeptidase [unclassified Nostoc]MBC1219322.1 M48 family metallopeptidase [Nostoc sp. UCD120]MBC1277505.1 M48 family metallopeptidase [Nostoc sp. UCD121]MBC1294807.1 M48 family metallopeptidase [Nostoc sp. UCD122]
MPTYTGISSEAFRHPLDRQAEQALRNLPGFDLIARKFVEFIYERPQLVYLMGNSIQVGPRQYSTIYQMFRECVRDLDIYPEPALFVSQDPQVNSYALGQENPYIVINTGILDLLDEAEIRAVLAHELGHIKCGHTILIQMAMWAMSAASALGELTFGLGNLVTQGLIYAFFEWRRKAELSSDRAALLVMDDLNPVMSTMMKLSGGSHKYANECSLQEFIKQSENYQALDEDGLNQIYKFLIYNGAQGTMLSHPFPVERLHYLRAWAVSEEYQQIRRGNYQRSPASGSVNVSAESSPNETDNLRRQIEELQREIDRIKRSE